MLGGYGAFWLVALLGLDPFVSLLLVIPLARCCWALVLYGGAVRASSCAPTRRRGSRTRSWSASGSRWRSTRSPSGCGRRTSDRSRPPTAARVIALGRPRRSPLVRLLSLAVAFALIGGLHAPPAHWRWGQAIRATAEDWQAALLDRHRRAARLLAGLRHRHRAGRRRRHARQRRLLDQPVDRARVDPQGADRGRAGRARLRVRHLRRRHLPRGGGGAERGRLRRRRTARWSGLVIFVVVLVVRPQRPVRASDGASRSGASSAWAGGDPVSASRRWPSLPLAVPRDDCPQPRLPHPALDHARRRAGTSSRATPAR